jgi:hypothetical protein
VTQRGRAQGRVPSSPSNNTGQTAPAFEVEFLPAPDPENALSPNAFAALVH